ncbi:MAG: ABC transporter ATP-binding protein [Pirellulales bacterium]|nr:ABC transporter ATP-binding protein [Pirellulales bacterium]
MIEFQCVTRSYGRKVAVENLTLTVPSREVFALLGPNGAGKTTTIKMLVGLLRPDAGSVRVCGFDLVGAVRQATRCLGYVPDVPFLYDKLSGREFLEFSAQMRGLDKHAVAAAITRENEHFEFEKFLDQLIETYSHGMKQRLVFAAALLHQPPVLVVDEPMVGMDPRTVRRVKDLLRLQATGGTTVFMSTHTLSVAEEIADRIGILDHGQLQFLGTVPELRNALASHHASLESLFLQLTSGNGEETNAPNAAPQIPNPEPRILPTLP